MGNEYIPVDQIKSSPTRSMAQRFTTGAAIATNLVVYASGLDGIHADLTVASNASVLGAQGPLYVTIQASNADGDTTRAVDWAVMTNLNTSGGAVGDPVWLTTVGAVSLTRPTADNQRVVVGRVISASATSGARTWVFDPKGETGAGVPDVLSGRYELKWTAGEDGLVGINADSHVDTLDSRFEVLGQAASADDVTFYAEGGLVFTTDGSTADQIILLPHLDASQSVWTETTWGTDKEVHWECLITSGGAITSSIIWAGLKKTNTSTLATDADQVFFRYENGVSAGVWVCVDSTSDNDVSTASTVTVAANTTYHLKIVIASDRTAKFYIDGALIRTTAVLTSIDLIPYIGIGATAGAGKVLRVHGQSISRNVAGA